MKIAIITRCLYSGGTERVIAKLSLMWSEMGHELGFITLLPENSLDYPHKCSWRIQLDETGDVAAQIKSAHEKTGFELVLVNGGWNADFYRPAIKAVYGIGGVKIGTILHHAFNNWAFSLENAGDFDKDDVLPLNDFIVTVDKLQALWWSRRHPCVFCICNPIAVYGSEVNDGLARCVVGSGMELLWVGRPNDKGKRVELAIDVFRLVAAKDKSAKLTVVGEIAEDKKDSLLGSLGEEIRNNVTFTGYVADTRQYLSKVAVNIVTTQWEVTVPQVILEAQALGVPTMALDLPVLRGVNGVKCVSSVEKMAAMILEKKELNSGTPFVDVDGRNRAVKSMWNDLFASLCRGDFFKIAEELSGKWRTIENAELLLDEIQRSETVHVHGNIPDLIRLMIWKGRLTKLINLLCVGRLRT